MTWALADVSHIWFLLVVGCPSQQVIGDAPNQPRCEVVPGHQLVPVGKIGDMEVCT